MLEVRGLSFGYPGARQLLYRDFSLCAQAGERVELRAPSGWGKTTLCRILAGYEKPLAGEVLVGGRPLPKRGASPVQLILQHPELAVDPRMRMADTLAEGLAGARGRAAAVSASEAEGAELDEFPERSASEGRRGLRAGSASRPGVRGGSNARDLLLSDAEARRVMDGLGIQEKWLARFPHELSGGELQRFCVARALLSNPSFLIADEISTMLDAVTQAQIWSFLLDEVDRANRGLVFVSHSPALAARIATRTVNLAE